MERKADWQNHHIEGFALAAMERGWKGDFSAPLITHMVTVNGAGELWQGGCINGVVLDSDFDQVVSLYPWEKFKLDVHTERVEITAYDSPSQDPTVFVSAAKMVSDLVLQGKKVLVHCQAGLNRSGVVCALALINLGYGPQEAIDLMREKRSPMVLCNESFERWVLSQNV
jgi:protein-tyrosine phosphatase